MPTDRADTPDDAPRIAVPVASLRSLESYMAAIRQDLTAHIRDDAIAAERTNGHLAQLAHGASAQIEMAALMRQRAELDRDAAARAERESAARGAAWSRVGAAVAANWQVALVILVILLTQGPSGLRALQQMGAIPAAVSSEP